MKLQLPEDAFDFIQEAHDVPPCPLCHQKWRAAPRVLVSEDYGVALVDRKTFKLNNTQSRVLQVLAASYGRWLAPDSILLRAWSDVPDIDCPRTIHPVSSSLSKLRTCLKGTRYVIELRRGFGYRLISKPDAKKAINDGKQRVTTKRKKPIRESEARAAPRKEKPSRVAAGRRKARPSRDR